MEFHCEINIGKIERSSNLPYQRIEEVEMEQTNFCQQEVKQPIQHREQQVDESIQQNQEQVDEFKVYVDDLEGFYYFTQISSTQELFLEFILTTFLF